MSTTIVRSASVDRAPIGESPAGIPVVRASRILGAGAAAVVAVATTLIAVGLDGGWFLALGIPSATVIG